MAGSGAGVNSVGNLGGIYVLTVPPGSTTPVAVADGRLAYGTNSGAPTQPGSATVGTDSGVIMLEAKGFTKWGIQIIGPGVTATTTAAFNIGVYGTIDPGLLARSYQTPANAQWAQQGFGNIGLNVGQQPDLQNSLTAIPSTSWSLVPMQAAGAVVAESNPLVTGVNTLGFISGPLVAIRVILTGTAPTTGTAGITVVAYSVP